MAERVRLDKWLWAARFYKTRSQSADAIKLGRVEVDGARAKPALPIGIGTRVHVRKGPYEFDVVVDGLAERRGSAEKARTLYTESTDSVARREEIRTRLAAERAARPSGWTIGGRPSKRDRRALRAFKDELFSSWTAIEDIEDDDPDDSASD